jgi:hypothetical protein
VFWFNVLVIVEGEKGNENQRHITKYVAKYT